MGSWKSSNMSRAWSADLEPLTILLVSTWHSVYGIVVVRGNEVPVQGGPFFPELPVAQRQERPTTGTSQTRFTPVLVIN
jgi:hypothetical protein